MSLAKGNRQFAFYIRKASATVKPSREEELDLINLAAKVPFDDRMHHNTALSV